MAESKEKQNKRQPQDRQSQTRFGMRQIRDNPTKVRDVLMKALTSDQVDFESLLGTAAILAGIPKIKLSANQQNLAFWDAVQMEFLKRHLTETDQNFDYKMPLSELAAATRLMNALSRRSVDSGSKGTCEITVEFSELAQRHCVRHGSSLCEDSAEVFAKALRSLVTCHGTRGQLIKALQDVCCECLADQWQKFSHRGLADMCVVAASLPLQPVQLQSVVTAVEQYLQQEIDSMEAGLVYGIARSIQVGNRASGGRALGSLGLDVLLTSRIVKDQGQLLKEIRRKCEDATTVSQSREKRQMVGALCSFIDCVRRTRAGPDGFDEAKRIEILEEALGVLYLLRHHLPPQRLTWDLEWLSKDCIFNKEYEGFLVGYIESNIGQLPLQRQLLLPKLMHKLNDKTQQRARDSLHSTGYPSESPDNKIPSMEGTAIHSQVQILEALIEAEGKDITEDTKSMLQKIFTSSSNIFRLNKVIKTLDDYEVQRPGNEDLWDSIFEKAESHKSQLSHSSSGGFQGFQPILLSLSNQGKGDPKALDQVGQLLHGMPVHALSVEAVLQLRNNVVRHHPDRNDIAAALELRTIGMLYKFGQRRGVTTLSSNHAKISAQLQAKKSSWSQAAGRLARSIPR